MKKSLIQTSIIETLYNIMACIWDHLKFL